MTARPARSRTAVRRLPEKTITTRATLDAILDSGLVAPVSICVDGQRFVVPCGYARGGDRILPTDRPRAGSSASPVPSRRT